MRFAPVIKYTWIQALHVFFPSTSPPSPIPNTEANTGAFQNLALGAVTLTTRSEMQTATQEPLPTLTTTS